MRPFLCLYEIRMYGGKHEPADVSAWYDGKSDFLLLYYAYWVAIQSHCPLCSTPPLQPLVFRGDLYLYKLISVLTRTCRIWNFDSSCYPLRCSVLFKYIVVRLKGRRSFLKTFTKSSSFDRRTCVPRPKDMRPPTEGHVSLDRRTCVLRPKDDNLNGFFA